MRLITIAAAAFLLTGCKQSQSPPAPAAPAVVAEKPVVQFDLRERAAEPRRDPDAPKAEPNARSAQAAAAPITNQEYQERTRQLLEAAEKGRVSLVLDMLKKGCDVNDKDDDGQTALHKAAAKGHKSLVLSLLVLGADMNERDAKGATPFMAAAEEGNAEVLNLLLSPTRVQDGAAAALGTALKEFKFNTDSLQNRLNIASAAANEVADKTGQTAVMLAAAGGHADCMYILLTSGKVQSHESVTRADKKGRNAIMHAAAGGHAGALDKIFNTYMQTPLTLDDLLATDADGKTALDIAEAGKHRLAVRRLEIEMGQKAAIAGNLPALKAAMEKHPVELPAQKVLKSAAAMGKAEVVKYILGLWKDKSADEKLQLVGAVEQVSSVLHDAMQSKNSETVKALIDTDWWKDKQALLRFINYRYQRDNVTVEPVLVTEYYRKEAPAVLKLVEERAKELQPAPKKVD